jgi:hypothetical protein
LSVSSSCVSSFKRLCSSALTTTGATSTCSGGGWIGRCVNGWEKGDGKTTRQLQDRNGSFFRRHSGRSHGLGVHLVVLHECYKGCYKGVTRVLQVCNKGVTWVLQGC